MALTRVVYKKEYFSRVWADRPKWGSAGAIRDESFVLLQTQAQAMVQHNGIREGYARQRGIASTMSRGAHLFLRHSRRVLVRAREG